MNASVRVRLGNGDIRELGPGAILGRAWSASLQLHDPWVSEAHALVSLREGALKLLGLRGKFEVNGRVTAEVVLERGQHVRLSERTSLEILEVTVPDHLLMFESEELGRVLLSGPTSLLEDGRVVAGPRQDAALVFWCDGEQWFGRSRDGVDQALSPGERIATGEVSGAIRLVRPAELGGATALDGSTIDTPLELVVRYETVHIHHGSSTLTLDGQLARFVSDLAVAGVPMSWTLLAAELWPTEPDAVVLRRNWDAAMSRLRRKLREAKIRADLVRADRGGNVELFLRRGDRVVDQT